LCDPARAFLLRIRKLVPEIAAEVVDVVASRDEDQVSDAGVGERVDGPLHHRLLADRKQMLVRDPRERIEP
jgi:hypothetical protein